MGQLVEMPLRREAGRTLEPWVTGATAARFFAVTRRTIERWRAEGMPSVKHGRGARRYRLGDIERWLREREESRRG